MVNHSDYSGGERSNAHTFNRFKIRDPLSVKEKSIPSNRDAFEVAQLAPPYAPGGFSFFFSSSVFFFSGAGLGGAGFASAGGVRCGGRSAAGGACRGAG
jgi:hypothetical protein